MGSPIIIPQRFSQRYDTVANWEAKNPVLWVGEIAYGTDAIGAVVSTRVGNGTDHWSDLPEVGGGAIDTINGGPGISIDSSDPRNPVISASVSGALAVADDDVDDQGDITVPAKAYKWLQVTIGDTIYAVPGYLIGPASGPPPETDPFAAYVLSLMHFDDLRNLLADVTGKTWSGASGLSPYAPISGSSSLVPGGRLSIDPTQMPLLIPPFTVEVAVVVFGTPPSGYAPLWSLCSSNVNSFGNLRIAVQASGVILEYRPQTGATSIGTAPIAWTTGVQRIALVCAADGTMTLWVNDQSAVHPTKYAGLGTSLYYGMAWGMFANGYSTPPLINWLAMDECRITAANRYPDGFTPPSMPFPDP